MVKSKKQIYKISTAQYLKKLKNPIIFAISLFIMSILFGLLNADLIEPIIVPILEGLINKTKNLNSPELAIFIFINNALTSVSSIISGIVFGIVPIITTASNGIVLGFVLERTAKAASILEWWRLLPHGIFELPAVFISIALGIKLGLDPVINYIKFYWKSEKLFILWPFLIAAVIIILTLIAVINQPAIIENKKISVSGKLIIPLFIIGSIIFYTAFTLFISLITSVITNKQLRKIQSNSFKINIYFSAKILIFIVIPLLIIAAIIESLLITLLE